MESTRWNALFAVPLPALDAPHAFLASVVLIGTVAAALHLLSHSAPVPYQVVLAAAGLALGLVPGVPLPHFGADLILLAFVPGLVFEAALSLDLDDLRRVWRPVGLLASLGVLVTLAVVGVLGHLVLGLGWPSALLLGAIVAPTDPIAVVAILRRLRAPGPLAALLDGESLFNDGTGVAVFAAVAAAIASGAPSPNGAALGFAVITLGGLVVGAAVGGVATALLRGAREGEVEILLTLVAAYGSYLAADVLHLSGVVAVVAAGIVVARFGRARGHLRGTQLLGFWSLLAFVLNALLFVLVGAAVSTLQVFAMAGMAAAGWLAMMLARLPLAYLLTPGVPWRWRHLCLWGGVRGALGVALALAVLGRHGVDQSLPAIAYGMVIISLLVQGGLMVPVARRLGLSGAGA